MAFEEPKLTYADVDRKIANTLEWPTLQYWMVLAVLGGCTGILYFLWGKQIYLGYGLTAINNPVGWGAYITTFVFWVGIAHSGTLISAVMYLLRAKWRNGVYRVAEAMTVIAVLTAGQFPLIHVGRVWFAFWLLPYPNQRYLWPNFMSPLFWDVLAVSTYLTVSTLFFLLGMIPDLAILRDRCKDWRKPIYTVLALGWKGSNEQWRHYNFAYLIFASLAAPLVISVHSVVSWDFATSGVPGWHTTIFAPYFVAGAIHSGIAMVITLCIPMRKLFKIEDIIGLFHLDAMAKVLIVTGSIVGYAYATEFFIAWYGGNRYELAQFIYRATGDYAIPYWTMVLCNCATPLLFFIPRFRVNIPLLFVVSLLINVGMWFERFNIIVISLAQEFDPYVWGYYLPNKHEMGIMFGSFAFFFTLFFIFAKFLPSVAIMEVKETLPAPRKSEAH